MGIFARYIKVFQCKEAQSIVEKLAKIDYYVADVGDGNEYAITTDETEGLAVLEHELWTEERMATGWKHGETKDVVKKTSPYLVPYEELSEDIKELDRDTIRNIPRLLSTIGLIVCKACG